MLAAYVNTRPTIGSFTDELRFGKVTTPYIDASSLKEGQVLVEIKAASINVDDIHLAQGSFFGGLSFLNTKKPTEEHPLIPGSDFAGIISALGPGCTNTKLKVGDAVCGLNIIPIKGEPGTWAKYTVSDEKRLYPLPKGYSFVETTAMIIPSLVAGDMIQSANIPESPLDNDGKGESPSSSSKYRCLVIGASGGIGSMAIQLIRKKGPHIHLVGVCSGSNVDIVKSLGADEVVDYTQGPLEEQLKDAPKFDCVMDLVGGMEYQISSSKLLIPRTGKYITSIGPESWLGSKMLSTTEMLTYLGRVSCNLLWNILPGSHPYYALAAPTEFKESALLDAVNAGVKPLMDRQVPFALQSIKDACNVVLSHHAKGKVVINMEITD